ncbi:glycoside hydrolase family 57 protein [Methylobacillus flagellatus]|uniref:glycoside hydrolase family 57 protein n=1 Tax=Methylobacillus flagellatus TaxID=405 RepID=UPI0010F5DCFF|nr:glycoside hydrolase family 57 protein [Methylobacillus flagellatus]
MKSSSPKLYLNLYWHMHQPDYRDTLTGEYVLPWTYLHAMKDYTDMAWHLESLPAARVTFNFVPVLLDQLEDYADQFATGKMRDPLLALLAEPDLKRISTAQHRLILESCFKCNHEKMLTPFADYQRLYNLYVAVETQGGHALDYLSSRYIADLLVWYHLAWTGESVRRTSSVVQALMQKGSHFTLEERQALFKLIGELITDLIPRYKKLKHRGQIEISSTPHHHPIIPLLIDLKSTRDAMPFAPLPQCGKYPGGQARARAHIVSAQTSHLKRFGCEPDGMWPSEGAVSHATLTLLAEHGVKWAASGEGVLAHSIYKSFNNLDLPPRQQYLYQPYRVTDGEHEIYCFFRDDQLSDKIGFEYSKLFTRDAVNDFIAALDNIRDSYDGEGLPVVSVILDGENAWEYYPYNGHYFLSELYEALSTHPDIEMTTFSDTVARSKADEALPVKTLPAIAAGSWVYGSFSTWIGSPDKNLGWDLLCKAKKQYDKVMQAGTLTPAEQAACEHQLAICEGSDWFWWFGDYNSAISVDSFDRLYRQNLGNLYRLLKLPVPDVLNRRISVGSGDPAMGGTMRRGQES